MKKIIYTILTIAFVFIVVGLALDFKTKGFNTGSVLNKLSPSTYGKIHFINVSKGSGHNSDAIVLESQGKICLVDSANPATFGDETLTGEDGAEVARYIKSLGATRLDCIIATHNHSDHIGGMPQIVSSGLVDSNTTYYYRSYIETVEDTSKESWDNKGYYNKAINAMNSVGAKLRDVTDDLNVTIDVGNFKIKLLNTESWNNKGNTGLNPRENNNSIVEYVTIGQKKVLLTADMEAIDENRLMKNGSIGKVDILKLGHHGGHTLAFLKKTNPSHAIVSGQANYYPPERSVIGIRYLLRNERPVYFTSKVGTGAIIVDFTSSNYTIKTSTGKNIKETLPVLQEVPGTSWNEDTQTGWIKIVQEGNSNRYAWYYLENGEPATGWKKAGGRWYFLQLTNGAMVTPGWKKYKEGWYYLTPKDEASDANPEGAAIVGWYVVDGKTYYFSPEKTDDYDECQMYAKAWKKSGQYWYYLGDSGAMVTGLKTIKGKTYFFETSSSASRPQGAMITGECRTVDGVKHCFNDDGVSDVTAPETEATIPTNAYCRTGLVYSGTSQLLTKDEGTGYTFSGNTASSVGSHTVTATLKEDYVWSDGSKGTKTFSCSIGKANNPINVTATQSWSATESTTNQNKAFTAATNAQGTLTYAVQSQKIGTNDVSYFSIGTSSTAKLTMKANTPAGTYTVVIRATAAGNTNYNSGSKDITMTVTVSESGGSDPTQKKVAKPTAANYCNSGLTYNGSTQTLTKTAGTGYVFRNNTGKNANTYTVTADLNDDYMWSDGSLDDVTFSCSIGKATPTISEYSTSISIVKGNSKTAGMKANVAGGFTISTNNSNISLSASSIAVAANEKKNLTVTGVTKGNTTVTLTFTPTDTTNYKNVSKTISVSVTEGSTPPSEDTEHVLTIAPNGGKWNNSTTNSTYNLKANYVMDISDPVRDYYVFKGWNINNSSTTIDDKTLTMGTQDTTITATWEKYSYKVSYDANGGTGTMSNQTGHYNTSMTLNANKFSRTNYKFKGWSLTPNGSVKYNDKATVNNLTLENGKTVTLYAVWVPNNYNVVYNSNGGTGTMENSNSSSDGTLKLRKNTFTKEGYTFVGWSLESDGNIVYPDEDIISNLSSSDSITLYASWLANSSATDTYKIKFNSGDGKGSMNDFLAYSNSTIMLRKNTFTRDGYEFAGWATAPGGEVVYRDGQVVNTITNDEAITLYAVWTSSSLLTVTYDANGGTGSMNSTSFYGGTDVQLEKNAFTKDGYEFIGWATEAGGKVVYTDEQDVSLTTSTKLYAVWESKDAIIDNVPDTLKFSSKVGIAIAIILITSGYVLIKKNTKKRDS